MKGINLSPVVTAGKEADASIPLKCDALKLRVSRRIDIIITMPAETPMLKQYMSLKKEYPDSILFFRLGDFYEMFYDDAKVASKVLGIALTSRNKNDKNPVPLCGVPHHSSEPYLAKLLRAGTR